MSWISVKDKLPEDNKIILVYPGWSDNDIDIAKIENSTWYRLDTCFVHWEWYTSGNNIIKYWMEIPDIPNEGPLKDTYVNRDKYNPKEENE